MTRINLYNYRYQELYYKKLRICLFLALGIFAALVLNLLVYGYYQFKIFAQQQRNAFLIGKLQLSVAQIKPLADFKAVYYY